MNSVKISTVRGYIKIVSKNILKYNRYDDGYYIQLAPNGGYRLQVYPDNGVFAEIGTKGNLTDKSGQEVTVGFLLRSDPTYCSPYVSFRIGYTEAKSKSVKKDTYM